ncbi:unnamed protein product, partial [Iphiclides podalirius]
MDAFVETVGTSVLLRRREICLTQRIIDALESGTEQAEYLSSMGDDFKSVVEPNLEGENPKRRIVMYPIADRPFSLVVCVIAPKLTEERVPLIVYEGFLRLFSQIDSLPALLHVVTEQAKLLLKAEHCSVMLIDVEHMDLFEVQYPSNNEMRNTQTVKRRVKMGAGITGLVVSTGKLVNAKNPKQHPNFDPTIDSYPDIECKSLLVFPIRDQSGIIGVVSIANRAGASHFDGMDEEMALAFSVYCGVCVVHSMVYQKLQEAHIRNALANELVMYHMKVSESEVSRLLECTGFHGNPHVGSLNFNPRALPLRELPCYALKMFDDLGLIKKFNLNRVKLARFILHVKKGYRDVPYHNWLHAFSVTQWAYAALVNYDLVAKGYLNDLQALMYLIACLVHDLDHRGTTSRFQIVGQTPLAALYSSAGSVLERHHAAQAACLLNTQDCDVLAPLPRAQYDRALLLLRDNVLATDLANFFRNLDEYKSIASDFQPSKRAHSQALRALLMNAADLSDQLKEWAVVKSTAAAVLTEYFKQGEMEKSRGGAALSIMDRDKCFIPELEKEFLVTTCVPLYDILARIIPKAQPCLKVLESHIEKWDAATHVFAEEVGSEVSLQQVKFTNTGTLRQVPVAAGLAVLLSPELDTLIEQSAMEIERKRLLEAEEEQAK